MKLNVIYQFCCPGCNSKYVGKTERKVYDWKDMATPPG